MTAVCLKAKSSVQTEDWSGIFTSFYTNAKSCIFVKQLTSTCISTILHLRKVLSDEYFEEKNLKGITLKLLKPRKGDSYVTKIEQWLEGAFEAIEKKYLKRLMLDIQDAESSMTLEVYTMTFNYNKEGNEESAFIPYDTETNTIKLLRMCDAITQAYSSLPPRVKLSMRLSYYENTPDDYQPRGYMAWEPVSPEFPSQARCVEIGYTRTQHHFFKLINKSCLNNKFFEDLDNFGSSNTTLPLEGNNENTIPERETKAKRELCFDNTNNFAEKGRTKLDYQVISERDAWYYPMCNDVWSFFKGFIKNLATPQSSVSRKKELFTACEKLITTPDQKEQGQSKVLVSETRKNMNTAIMKVNNYQQAVIKNQKVRCACLSSEKSKTMFSCLECKFLVHAECYGILYFDVTRKIRFYCHLCHQKGNFKCHDKVLVGLKNSSDQQKLSVLRKILRYCTNTDKITLNRMEKIAGTACPKNVVIVVLNKMIEIGVAVFQRKRKSYLINKTQLEKKLLQYFYKVHDSNQSCHQVLPYSLRNLENIKRKNNLHNFPFKKDSKQPTAVPEEHLNNNSQTSQQSCDIFYS